ncbi:deoxycytidylate deaminase [Haploplasma modicum]|uniref:deoxycytidylate deaminase n=1 Tax=Haploplasma modicum TaxID=2150 RepID=UPI00047AD842|nr:dCMP deaminase family protein [Haploplasma modicum]MCR1808844.1 dCMP deaminase family protein [Haploplasma modicum]
MKRNDYITWDQYFMGVASLSALRSKDPNTRVGACIVNDENRIIGIGYNGFPKGVSDDLFPWGNNETLFDSKYAYVVHAEANAILNATSSVKDATIYVTLFPCNECSKLIIQSGIKKIKYVSDKYADTEVHKASVRMLDAANVSYEKIEFGEIKYVEAIK